MKVVLHRLARKRAVVLATVITAAALLPLSIDATAGATPSPPTWTATTVLSIRPTSGNHDNPVQGVNHTWADSSFTRSATVSFYGQVAKSFCPGITSGECYYWTGESLDTKGMFTTNPTAKSGAYSPGNGTNGTGATGPFAIGVAARGTVSGRYHYGFYTNFDTGKISNVPTAENDHGTMPLAPATSTCTAGVYCGTTDCQWIEQFFPKGAQFWDLNGNLDPSCLGLYGSWFYFLPRGSDESCSLVMSQWITATWNNFGSDPVDGNVLAPDESHC